MGWDSKPVYPSGALYTVTVKATYEQRLAWQAAAKKYNKGTAGGFLAWSATMAIAALNALETTASWPGD